MIGVACQRAFFFTDSQNSKPFIPGISMSLMIRSNSSPASVSTMRKISISYGLEIASLPRNPITRADYNKDPRNVAMKAEKIVYLTAVPGLLEDAYDETTLVPRLTAAELRDRIDHDSVGEGMIPKLKACADAVEQGVGFAHIIDGRVHHSLLIELLTDHGVGTMVKLDQSW